MKVGIVFGTWDLLHAGHIHLLRECKKRCDKLVVGLHVDPSLERDKNKPIETLLERQIKLFGCKFVDYVIVYEKEEDLPLIADLFNVNVRFLGSDYKDGKKPMTFILNVPIKFIESLPIHTTDIRRRV